MELQPAYYYYLTTTTTITPPHLERDVQLLGLVAVGLVAEHAHGHAGLAQVGQTQLAAETLVALRVVVLDANLELHGLDEAALLALCERKERKLVSKRASEPARKERIIIIIITIKRKKNIKRKKKIIITIKQKLNHFCTQQT